MPREQRDRPKIKESAERREEEGLVWSLRPKTLQEFIGQSSVIDNLRIAITAARNRKEPLEHALFYGPPGLGKTTLAHIIAVEMQATIISSSGPALERRGDLMGILTNLERGDVLFIDEIHRLSRPVEEFMYSAMEDFQVDFVLDKGAFAKTIKIPLKPFTLVGATTRPGMLTAPLRERFGLLQRIDFYPPEETEQVVHRSAALLKVPTDQGGAREIAQRSRGTPRIANRLLRRVRDYAQVEADGRITQAIAVTALNREGIDPIGLDLLDRTYLKTIIDNYDGGPVGIEALAATINEEADTLQDLVEPFLLKIGFLTRTSTGRKATEAARRHLGSHPQQRLL